MWVQVVWETLFQAWGLYGLAFAAGAAVGVLASKAPKVFYRRRLTGPVATAYDHLALVCEPEILNPENPGNMDYMRARARGETDLLINDLQRAGFWPPAPISDGDAESFARWFEFLREVRRALS